MSLNIINNTKAVADSFVNDQLKWRRERIEKLSTDLQKKNRQIDDLKQLYKNECDFVKQLRDLFKFTLETAVEDMDAIPNAKELLSLIDKHVEINDNFFNNKL